MQKSRHTLLGDHIDILHGSWILYHFVRIRSLNRVWKICYYNHLFHVQVHNILNVSKWRHICWIIFTIWPSVANWKLSPTVDIMGYMAPYLIRVYRWKYIMIRFNSSLENTEGLSPPSINPILKVSWYLYLTTYACFYFPNEKSGALTVRKRSDLYKTETQFLPRKLVVQFQKKV